MIHPHKKAVIFDFDGTLADTAPDMVAALNNWLATQGRPPVDAAQASRLCSGGARALLGFCGVQDSDMPQAVVDYLALYEKTDYQNTRLYPGISAVLSSLCRAGIAWGVATNKPQRFFAPIAARLLTPYNPATLICRNDKTLPPKPHPATLYAAAKECGAAVCDCVYVGDDVRDGQAAQAAGMDFIAVTWGYWRDEQWTDNAPMIQTLIAQPEQLVV